jgi:cell wall assembly regulator SMI1
LATIALSVLLYFWPWERPLESAPYALSGSKPDRRQHTYDESRSDQIKSLCARLNAAIQRRLPDAHESGELNPPASDAELAELEHFICGELPADLRAYLKTMNGQKGRVAIPGTARLLSAARILKDSNEHVGFLEYSMATLPLETGNYPYWHPRMLMFSQMDGDGDVIDVVTGEVRSFVHDGGLYQVHTKSLLEHLQKIVKLAEDDDEMMLDFGPPRRKKLK